MLPRAVHQWWRHYCVCLLMMYTAVSLTKTQRPDVSVLKCLIFRGRCKGYRACSNGETCVDVNMTTCTAICRTKPNSTDPQQNVTEATTGQSSRCARNFLCQNGGYCNPESVNGWPACVCPQNYTGVFCQKECPRKCQNNGTCTAICRTKPNSTDPQQNVTEATTGQSSRCAGNFVCQNGGYCNPESVNRTTECVCPQNYTGDFCQKKCSTKCQNNGTCILVRKSPKCRCLREFTGPLCEDLMPEESKGPPDTEVWYIPVIICFAVLFLGVVVFFTIQKLRWRSLLITKIFHYFQPYEDEDGKLFDAFISFKSSKKDYGQSEDEKFVLRVLQPMLEKEFQYKVCVHYRDFLPGETIANNIMWAVENSRRTILILSPLYVESEWARLEYQKAQQEMLQLHHKIIPVIFEDISGIDIQDSNLKHILSSVTYINYPSDEKEHSKFWQMLQLALPKKRSSETETSSTSSTSSHPPLTLTSSQTLMSQESWQSGRTDVTDVSGDIEMNEVTCDNNVSVDVNELDKSGIKITIDDPNEKRQTLNNNADKFISILERVS